MPLRRRAHTYSRAHTVHRIPRRTPTHAGVQCYAIVPSSFPFIHSVKHDTCINSGWILELCVLSPYVFLSRALSSPITTTVSICCLAAHHKRADLLLHIVCGERRRDMGLYGRSGLYCCSLAWIWENNRGNSAQSDTDFYQYHSAIMLPSGMHTASTSRNLWGNK